MIERTLDHRFLPGYVAFPGGAVDPADRRPRRALVRGRRGGRAGGRGPRTGRGGRPGRHRERRGRGGTGSVARADRRLTSSCRRAAGDRSMDRADRRARPLRCQVLRRAHAGRCRSGARRNGGREGVVDLADRPPRRRGRPRRCGSTGRRTTRWWRSRGDATRRTCSVSGSPRASPTTRTSAGCRDRSSSRIGDAGRHGVDQEGPRPEPERLHARGHEHLDRGKRADDRDRSRPRPPPASGRCRSGGRLGGRRARHPRSSRPFAGRDPVRPRSWTRPCTRRGWPARSACPPGSGCAPATSTSQPCRRPVTRPTTSPSSTSSSGALFTGDTVLGRGTSFIDPPDGDLVQYLRSLRRLLDLDPRSIYPGHGPVVLRAREKLLEYLAHREEREAQVVSALAEGPRTIAEMVQEIYADHPAEAHPLAARSVLAQLRKLADEGRAERSRQGRRRTVDRFDAEDVPAMRTPGQGQGAVLRFMRLCDAAVRRVGAARSRPDDAGRTTYRPRARSTRPAAESSARARFTLSRVDPVSPARCSCVRGRSSRLPPGTARPKRAARSSIRAARRSAMRSHATEQASQDARRARRARPSRSAIGPATESPLGTSARTDASEVQLAGPPTRSPGPRTSRAKRWPSTSIISISNAPLRTTQASGYGSP